MVAPATAKAMLLPPPLALMKLILRRWGAADMAKIQHIGENRNRIGG